MPRVSIIMACHNAALFIEQAIKSVLKQTYDNFELIIVDDASTDNSLYLSQKMAREDARISVYPLTKQVGAGAARNIAIDLSKGEWLAILDADDIFLGDKLEKQLRAIDKAGSDLVLIGTNSFEIDAKGNRLSLQKYPTDSLILIANLVRRKRFPPHSSLMYRTDVVNSLNGFNRRFYKSQDYDLWLRLSRCGLFALVPEYLIEYRHHTTNISNTNAGFDQLVEGIAAATCHFIRMVGGTDPSCYSSDDNWNIFINWIGKRIVEEGVFDHMQTKNTWRKSIVTNNNSIIRKMEFIKCTVLHPASGWRIIKEKYFGTRLPQQLANQWLQNHVLKN